MAPLVVIVGIISVCVCVFECVSALCLLRCFATASRSLEVGTLGCQQGGTGGFLTVHVMRSAEGKCHTNVKCISTKTSPTTTSVRGSKATPLPNLLPYACQPLLPSRLFSLLFFCFMTPLNSFTAISCPLFFSGVLSQAVNNSSR